MESSPFAETVQTLAGIHQTQHQVIIELCMDQEQCFQALFQVQAEDRQVLQSPVQPADTPAAAPAALPHITLTKMCS